MKSSTKRPFQAFPLVEVLWMDASAMPPGWANKLEDVEPQIALSVGFLLAKVNGQLVIAQDLDADGHHNGRSQIPLGMVRKIKVLRKAD
jgi:hypothetical protein